MAKEKTFTPEPEMNDQQERGQVLDKILALVSQAFKLFNEYEERVNSSSAKTPQGTKTK